MKIEIVKSKDILNLDPLTDLKTLDELPIANIKYEKILRETLHNKLDLWVGVWFENLFPSNDLLNILCQNNCNTKIVNEFGNIYAKLVFTNKSKDYKTVFLDEKSIIIKNAWDILAVNELVISQKKFNKKNNYSGHGVIVNGNLEIGDGSVLLPGVYVEGNVIIGKNCKIGPNCYLRGNTSIGDNSFIGNGVEIKNSLIMDNVKIPHLNYVGDSVISSNTNFGGGTVVANFRHDGMNHFSMVNNKLIDTGRKKLGVIVGENVHFGINTSIYPGRKIWADCTTLPGEIVKKDIKSV